MALTGTDRGAAGSTTGTTTFTGISPNATIAAGSLGVLIITADNAGAGGATPVCPATITDSVGNVWTLQQNPIYDPGAASAGVETGAYTCRLTTQVTTGDNVNITWAGGASVGSKCYAFHEVSASIGVPTYVTGGAGTGAASAAPTVTTASIPDGDMVIGFGGAESADTWAGDADSTNGSWSTHQHAAGGSGATGMSLTTQRKVVTATATQSYDPTLTSADQIIGWIQVTEVIVFKQNPYAQIIGQ